MIQVTIDVRALRRIALVAGLLAAVAVALLLARSARAAVGDPPLPTVAFLARADNPVDALAASGVAGRLGAPVFLTNRDGLDADAAAGLSEADPDVVVLAGGVAALSDAVEAQVGALLPDAQVIRRAGATRQATAVAVNRLPDELGFDRPVVTGATVAGDAGITGELTVAGTDVAATIATLQERVTHLEALLAGVTRTADTLRFSGVNVQVVNGTGHTGQANGLGNLIVGYGEDDQSGACLWPTDGSACEISGDGFAEARTGSHNLVLGVDQSYTGIGGILAGHNNLSSGWFASVLGGLRNVASGDHAVVLGGNGNQASGDYAVVGGGTLNVASGPYTTVSGGDVNEASGFAGVVSGGAFNAAPGYGAVVSGGVNNTAGAQFSSIVGGRDGTIDVSPSTNNDDSLIGNSTFADG